MATLENIPIAKVQTALERDASSLSLPGSGKAVVVHRGARDGYQVALALAEAGLLESLITDLFWGEDSQTAKVFGRYMPGTILSALRQRSVAGLSNANVSRCTLVGLVGLLSEKMPGVPFSLMRSVVRVSDAMLGRKAGHIARRRNAALVSYSYYGYDAFRSYGRKGMLFQLHPHPATMRRILNEELEMHPDCASSLRREWELSLPQKDYLQLVQETAMADRYLVASSFTRDSLIENGVRAESIQVIPYGVDLERFRPDPAKSRSRSSKLRLLFVGRINQRKGVKYLVEALRQLNTRFVELTICGRVVDNLDLFKPFSSQIEIRESVSIEELAHAYQNADLFVFPSVGEGFGHVLLESLASGLPILSTTHTAAPDLIREGAEGFVVEPRRPDLLAERIDWAIRHRTQLVAMEAAARECAQRYSWQRYRSTVAEEVRSYIDRRRRDEEVLDV